MPDSPADRIQLRRDVAANWELANPTLVDGEFAYDKTTKTVKVGDGTTAWTDLQRLHTNYLQRTYSTNRTLISTDAGMRLRFTSAANLNLADVVDSGDRFEVYAQGGNVTLIDGGDEEVIPEGGVVLVTKDASGSWLVTDYGGEGLPDYLEDTALNATYPQGAVPVEAYDAVGDGSTDNAAFLATAIADADVIALRVGLTYKVNTELAVASPVVIEGNGSTIALGADHLVAAESNDVVWRNVKFTGSNVRMFKMIDSGETPNNYTGWTFIDCEWDGVAPHLSVVGRESNIPGTFEDGSDILSAVFVRPWVHDVADTKGLSCEGTRDVRILYPRIERVGVTQRIVTDAAMTASDATLTSATAAFVAGDVGRSIIVEGAGLTEGNTTRALAATISSVTNGTTVELSRLALTTTSAARAIISLASDAGDGIKIATGALDTVIIGGVIQENARLGMSAFDSVGTTVIGTTFRRNGNLGADAKWDSVNDANDPKEPTFLGCTFDENIVGGLSLSQDSGKAVGCRAHGNDGFGMRAVHSSDGAQANTKDVLFSGCHSHHNTGEGLSLQGLDRPIVRDFWATGNDYGIRATSSADPIDDLTLSGIHCYGNATSDVSVASTLSLREAHGWIGAGQLGITRSTPTESFHATTRVRYWTLADAVNSGVGGSIRVPDEWKTVAIVAVWANGSAAAGDVSLLAVYGWLNEPDTMASGFTIGTTTTVTAAAQDLVKRTTLATVANQPGGKHLHVSVERLGSGGADTLAGDARLLGIAIVRRG